MTQLNVHILNYTVLPFLCRNASANPYTTPNLNIFAIQNLRVKITTFFEAIFNWRLPVLAASPIGQVRRPRS